MTRIALLASAGGLLALSSLMNLTQSALLATAFGFIAVGVYVAFGILALVDYLQWRYPLLEDVLVFFVTLARF